MKSVKPLLAAGLAGLLASASSGLAQAQIGPAVQNTPDRDGRVIISDPQAAAIGATTTLDRQKLSAEVRDRLARFEKIRDAYLREQEELRRRLRGATTDADRERIREQMKQSVEAWRERSRNLREELKDRLATLREQMPTRTEVLDNARENLRDADLRKRRGRD
jgi:cell division protein FtsI/penicillin-binding protein 2